MRLTPDAAGPDHRSGLLTPTQPCHALLHSSPSVRWASWASPLNGRPGRRTLRCPCSSSCRLHQGRAPDARPLTRIGPTPDADPPLDTSPLSRTGPRARPVTRMAGPAGAGPPPPALPYAQSSGAAAAYSHCSCASVAPYRQGGVPGWPQHATSTTPHARQAPLRPHAPRRELAVSV